MKKLLLLFAVMLSTVGAWAQISDLTELDNSKAYLLKNANNMGYAIWKDGNNLTLCGATSTYTDPLDESAEGSYWQIVNYNEQYYLYNVGAQKFAVTQKGATYLTETPTPIKVKTLTNGFAFNSTDDGYTFMCAAHHLNPPVQWWSSDDNGSAWQIIESEFTGDELNALTVVENYFNTQVDVTFEYYINGKLYHTSEVVKHNINIAPEVPALDYVTIGATEPATITEACTVKVTCTENLPFVSSASYEEATWQVIDMHSNEDNYTWKFVAVDANVETPVMAKSQNASLGDEYYWAFVGNLVDGFKIYNKAAGASFTLRKAENGNKPSVMSATDDRNIFKLHKSASSRISNSFCFKIDDDTHYVNKQNKTLQGWTAKDEGSSCRIFTPASFVLNTLGGFESAPSGAVGSYSYLADAEKYATFAPVIAAVKADQYDIEALEALDELNMVADIVASEKVAMAPGYYRIQNLFRPQTGIKNMIGIVNGARKGATGNMSAVDFIWEFETSNDGYKVKNLNRGLYMNTVSDQSLVEETNAGVYGLVDLGAAQWKLTCGGENLVMFFDNGTLGHWGSVSQNGDGAWYIIPATELDITVSDAGWATTCLPFDVVLPEELTAYALTDVSGVNGEGTGSVSLISKAGIKAYEGALLKGSAGTYTLSIEETASNWDANLLSGTTVAKDMSTVTGDVYLLTSDGAGSAQLSKLALATSPTDAQKTLAANKAYLNIDPSATRYFVFNFGDDTETAIEGIEAENTADAVVYDLAGRRVQKVQKGLYIVNGKKVIK